MKRKKRIGTVGKAIGCLFFLMVSLFPIYWLVAMAIRPTDEMRGHIALIPQSQEIQADFLFRGGSFAVPIF